MACDDLKLDGLVKTFATAPGRVCFKRQSVIGPVPIFVEAEMAPKLTITFGGDVDGETGFPAMLVKPAVALEVEVKGGVGGEIGPVEVAAGVQGALTLVELAFPVKYALAMTQAINAAKQVVQDVWKVQKLVISQLELTFLRLGVGVFFEIGIGPFKLSDRKSTRLNSSHT